MFSEEGRVDVAVVGSTVYVRPVGYATQNNSLGLPDFFSAMFQQGCTNVTFDLKECCGMDSSFLGVIAVAAMAHVSGRRKCAVILNASPPISQTLRMIGLLPVVAVPEGAVEPPPDLVMRQVDLVHLPKTERDRVEVIKTLHEELIRLNERNRERFSRFVEMLEAELQGENSVQ